MVDSQYYDNQTNPYYDEDPELGTEFDQEEYEDEEPEFDSQQLSSFYQKLSPAARGFLLFLREKGQYIPQSPESEAFELADRVNVVAWRTIDVRIIDENDDMLSLDKCWWNIVDDIAESKKFYSIEKFVPEEDSSKRLLKNKNISSLRNLANAYAEARKQETALKVSVPAEKEQKELTASEKKEAELPEKPAEAKEEIVSENLDKAADNSLNKIYADIDKCISFNSLEAKPVQIDPDLAEQRILTILEKNFASGLRPNSLSEINRLNEKYFCRYKTALNYTDAQLSAVIDRIGLHRDGRIFVNKDHSNYAKSDKESAVSKKSAEKLVVIDAEEFAQRLKEVVKTISPNREFKNDIPFRTCVRYLYKNKYKSEILLGDEELRKKLEAVFPDICDSSFEKRYAEKTQASEASVPAEIIPEEQYLSRADREKLLAVIKHFGKDGFDPHSEHHQSNFFIYYAEKFNNQTPPFDLDDLLSILDKICVKKGRGLVVPGPKVPEVKVMLPKFCRKTAASSEGIKIKNISEKAVSEEKETPKKSEAVKIKASLKEKASVKPASSEAVKKASVRMPSAAGSRLQKEIEAAEEPAAGVKTESVYKAPAAVPEISKSSAYVSSMFGMPESVHPDASKAVPIRIVPTTKTVSQKFTAKTLRVGPIKNTNSEERRILEVLRAKYSKCGLYLGASFLEGFREIYKSIHKSVLNLDDDALSALLRRIGLERDGRIFAPLEGSINSFSRVCGSGTVLSSRKAVSSILKEDSSELPAQDEEKKVRKSRKTKDK